MIGEPLKSPLLHTLTEPMLAIFQQETVVASSTRPIDKAVRFIASRVTIHIHAIL